MNAKARQHIIVIDRHAVLREPEIEIPVAGVPQRLLHPADHDEHAFVQCRHHFRGEQPVAVEVIGWTTGLTGKNPSHWWTGKNGLRPCYRVPDEILTPGPGQIRALFVVGAAPAIGSPSCSARTT